MTNTLDISTENPETAFPKIGSCGTCLNSAIVNACDSICYAHNRASNIVNDLVNFGILYIDTSMVFMEEGFPDYYSLASMSDYAYGTGLKKCECDVLKDHDTYKSLMSYQKRAEEMLCAWERAYEMCGSDDKSYRLFKEELKKRLIEDEQSGNELAKDAYEHLKITRRSSVVDDRSMIMYTQGITNKTEEYHCEMAQYLTHVIAEVLGIDHMAEALANGVPKEFI